MDSMIINQQKELDHLNSLTEIKKARIENGRKAVNLMEVGRKLELEARIELRRVELANKVKADEHARQVLEVETEARKLEEEETALLGQLASINHHIIVPQIQMRSKANGYRVVDEVTPVFSPELFMLIAPHLPAKDQLSLRLLNKSIKKVLPKVFILNFRYFKESLERLVKTFKHSMLISEIPVHFKLARKEVERNPYGVLELARAILKGNYHSRSAAIHSLLGDSLKVAVPEVLRRSHQHPKFKLLNIYLAVFANNKAAVQSFLSSTDNSTIPDSHFQCALQYSSQAGYDEVIKLLLLNPGVNLAGCYNLAIQFAALEGRTSTVQLLLQDPRVSPSDDNNACIRYAASRGRVDTVKLLLEDQRVDWKANNFEALRWAGEYGHDEIVKMLVQHFVAHP